MTENKSLLNKFSFGLWAVTACFTALLLAFIMGAAMFRHVSTGGEKIPHSISILVSALGEMPSLVKMAIVEVIESFKDEPTPLLTSKDKVWGPNWEHKFPVTKDDGYLLLSGLNALKKQSTVRLIRIADGSLMAEWTPDWKMIHSKISEHRWFPKGHIKTYRAVHPLLLKDGSIIFNTGSSLIRQPLCSSSPSWVIDYPHHHSIELDPDGKSIWTASVTDKFFVDHPILSKKLRDDSIANVSLEGKVINNLSFSKILFENNLISQLMGSTGTVFNEDLMHINQITPAKKDSAFWQRGDLLISVRHLSTVYLYRPSTGKILWHKQGPWLNQHSAHFFKNDTIIIFGNDVYIGNQKLSDLFITSEKRNAVYLHDIKTGATNQLQTEALNELKPRTGSQGRVTVLKDMSMFIEETANARLLKIDPSGQLVWSYINMYDANRVGNIAWSRYISLSELESTIKLSELKCK